MFNKFIALNNIWIQYRSMLFSNSRMIEEVFYLTDSEKVRSHNVKRLDNETIIKNFSLKNHLTNTQDFILSIIPFKLFTCDNLIVFGWSYWQIVFVLLYRKIFNKKTVIFFESVVEKPSSHFKQLKNNLKKIFLSKDFYYCSPSLNCDHYLNQIYKDIKIERINNFSKYSPELDKINNTKREIDFLYVGRNSEEKNIEFLLNLYLKNKNKYSFMFVGDFFPNVMSDDQISFTEIIEDYYLRSKYLILPSKSEPYGMVAIEAYCCGCIPLVKENCGVASELPIEFIFKDELNLNYYHDNYKELYFLINHKNQFSLESATKRLDEFLDSI